MNRPARWLAGRGAGCVWLQTDFKVSLTGTPSASIWGMSTMAPRVSSVPNLNRCRIGHTRKYAVVDGDELVGHDASSRVFTCERPEAAPRSNGPIRDQGVAFAVGRIEPMRPAW